MLYLSLFPFLFILLVVYFIGFFFSEMTRNRFVALSKKARDSIKKRNIDSYYRSHKDYLFPAFSLAVGALFFLLAIRYYPLRGHVDNYIQLAIAYATFLVIIHAVYIGDDAETERNKPIPFVVLNFAEPDCHLTLSGSIPTYFVRFKVLNNGLTTMRNAEVIIEKVMGSAGPINTFLPLNLTWALTEHQGNRGLVQIPQGMFRTVDLLKIMEPTLTSDLSLQLSYERGKEFESDMFNELSKKMAVCSVVEPRNLSQLLSPGAYMLYCSIVSDNTCPIFAKISVEYDGTWEPSVADMFGRHIRVSLVKQGEIKDEVYA